MAFGHDFWSTNQNQCFDPRWYIPCLLVVWSLYSYAAIRDFGVVGAIVVLAPVLCVVSCLAVFICYYKREREEYLKRMQQPEHSGVPALVWPRSDFPRQLFVPTQGPFVPSAPLAPSATEEALTITSLEPPLRPNVIIPQPQADPPPPYEEPPSYRSAIRVPLRVFQQLPRV